MSKTSSKNQHQRRIDSFFISKPSVRKERFETPLSVPGLSLIDNFVSRDEEQQLLTFLSTQNWRSDLARRVIHYGGSYCLMPPRNASAEEKSRIESTVLLADPMPSAFDFLLEYMVDARLYMKGNTPRFCIVNEYTGSQGISAHVENFKFDEPVCGLTLGDSDWMRFHELKQADDGSVRSGRAAEAERTGRKIDVRLPSRSMLIMRGDSRYKWQHEICRSSRGRITSEWRRTSLTFRVERMKRGLNSIPPNVTDLGDTTKAF